MVVVDVINETGIGRDVCEDSNGVEDSDEIELTVDDTGVIACVVGYFEVGADDAFKI